MNANAGIIQIISLEPREWRAYKDLRLKSLTTDPLAFGKTLKEEKAIPDKEWREKLQRAQSGDVILLFARDGDALVGMTGAKFARQERLSHVATVIGTYVDPTYRGKGVGKQLLGALLKDIRKQRRIKKVQLKVSSPQKAAIRLYTSFGFKKTGRLQKDLSYRGRYYDGFIMEKLF